MLPSLPETRLSPPEFALIAFEGDQFTGDILLALADLVATGMARIVDLAFASKRADGTVTILEALIALTGEVSSLLTEGDLMEVAEDIDPGMTAAGRTSLVRAGGAGRQ